MVSRLALVVLLAGCTTLEGFDASSGLAGFWLLDDRERLPGGLVRVEDGQLVLTTNVTASCPACGPGEDDDGDGLRDTWERLVSDHLRPALALREDEPSLAHGDGGLVALSRITPGEHGTILVFYVFLWDDDAGRCSVGRHHGDTERIVLELTKIDERHARLSGFYGSAHEATSTDASTLLLEDELGDLSFHRGDDDDDDHILVQVAAGKHAFYPREGQCSRSGSMCRRDLCSGLVMMWPVVIRTFEVGEPWATRFPPIPIDPWDSRPYCGMLGRRLVMDCAPAIFDKLMEDPFLGGAWTFPVPPPPPG